MFGFKKKVPQAKLIAVALATQIMESNEDERLPKKESIHGREAVGRPPSPSN
jgi:hypothetical protein